jgi:hypothetical protein
MRQTILALASFFLVFAFGGQTTAVGAPPASDSFCQGSSCLNIYNLRIGTRCNTSDSVQVDISNDSGSLYLRGYVVFHTPTGKVYVQTNLLKPGQKVEGDLGPAYVCHGLGTPTGIANTGSDPEHLSYPPKN